MGYAHLTKHIDAPPQAVFNIASQSERLPQWLTLITAVDPEADRLDHEGAAFTADMKIGGDQLHVRWEVTEAAEPNHVHLKGEAGDDGAASAVFAFGLWEAGTEVTVEIDWQLPGGFLHEVADKLFVERSIARELKHSLENLRDIVENHG